MGKELNMIYIQIKKLFEGNYLNGKKNGHGKNIMNMIK